jgi:K(+)-stimulated pyrophosphate-energized sodium pump
VTGVALISFIALAVMPEHKSHLLVWIFVMRILMIVTSIVAVLGERARSCARRTRQEEDRLRGAAHQPGVDHLAPVDRRHLRGVALDARRLRRRACGGSCPAIISCGTLAAALIPELTKAFTSSNSRHTREIVAASREGGAPLTILSGLVAGNFSVFWMCLTITTLLFLAYLMSLQGLAAFMGYPAVFAFGLVAFGLLGMGPVTIAVDSYGPVTDNAQSIFELSQIETRPGASAEIEKKFGFKPDYALGKHFLEDNDGAGNTFKATAKPVLIATAVAGATTMIFSLFVLLKKKMGAEFDLTLTEPRVLLGIIMGGATIYWFTGALDAGGHHRRLPRGRVHQAQHPLESAEKASIQDSKEVVRICTQYAQAGMFNIFIVIFCLTLAYAFFDPIFFVSYLISIAAVGLFQAIYMANAGGAWDNAKKVVEVELMEKGSELHAATVVGDTGGRSVQGHLFGRAQPDHQVHDAVRPARGRDRGREPGGRAPDRGGADAGRAGLRVPLVLRHAHRDRSRSRPPRPRRATTARAGAPEPAARH